MHTTSNNTQSRILRLPEVKQRTGLSRTTIYERVKAGNFPKHVSLGGRSIGWLESEIDSWIAACVMASRLPTSSGASNGND